MNAPIRSALLGLCAAVLGACAHPITIAPDLDKLEAAGVPPRAGAVGLYLPPDAKGRQVITAGGGGDKVSYYPYRDLEAGIYKVLTNLYARVVLVPSPADGAALARDGVALVAQPTITTQSSSDSILTWPPTDFEVQVACKFTNAGGAVVAEPLATGKGKAAFAEFASDFSLAGKRASEDALNKLQRAIIADPKLH